MRSPGSSRDRAAARRRARRRGVPDVAPEPREVAAPSNRHSSPTLTTTFGRSVSVRRSAPGCRSGHLGVPAWSLTGRARPNKCQRVPWGPPAVTAKSLMAGQFRTRSLTVIGPVTYNTLIGRHARTGGGTRAVPTHAHPHDRPGAVLRSPGHALQRIPPHPRADSTSATRSISSRIRSAGTCRCRACGCSAACGRRSCGASGSARRSPRSRSTCCSR